MADTMADTAGMLASSQHNIPTSADKRNKKIIYFAIFGSFLLVAAMIGLSTSLKSKLTFDRSTHTILKSSCQNTMYPELCFSTLATHPAIITKKVKTPKDVIELSINITMKAVQQNHASIERLLERNNLTKRERGALNDCLVTMDEALDELQKANVDLEGYPSKKTLQQHTDDLKTLMSAAMTNPDACIDGFSHDSIDKQVRHILLKDQDHIWKMCSNALAMICDMTGTDIANEEKLTGRKLKEELGGGEWPEWLSAGDRRLLQSSKVSADVVVATDGSGDYKTISQAVASAPRGRRKRYIIRIKSGVYREHVEVPQGKSNIMFVGDGTSRTIITGSKNVVDGSTTFGSATVGVMGAKFLARDLTIQNTAGPSKHQAVALRVGGDLSAFYRCDILGYQDTLFVYANRQFFVQCLIAGTIDFIFGNSAVVFQNCDIQARRPNPGQKNTVTAQARTDPNQNTGIVIQKSRISSDLGGGRTYLGRPWKLYSRTVVMESTLSNEINPAGWLEWSGSFALNTLFYGEYKNAGPGASTSGRVKWKGFKVITSSSEAQEYAPGRFIGGGNWLRSSGFPYSLGL